ncbi:MAG: hypothetical protein HY433_03810 [Candidatus Liptonbacteria bacterium]|nr:hypothetical protein [Candidatus Liptonbacteria bacterium]
MDVRRILSVLAVIAGLLLCGTALVAMSTLIEMKQTAKNAYNLLVQTKKEAKAEVARLLETRGMERNAILVGRQRRLTEVESIAVLFSNAAPKAEWVSVVRTGSGPTPAEAPSFKDRVCVEVDRFWAMSRALRAMRPGSGSGITWEELGIQKSAAEKMYWDAGITAARSVFGAFQAPRKDREGDGCGNLSSFLDPLTLGNEIVYILDAIGGEPKHIGGSPAHLRQWVLYDMRARLAEMRAEGGTDAQVKVIAMAKAAMKGEPWKYTATELALTADEAKATEPPVGKQVEEPKNG